MKCEETESLLNAYIDEEIAATEAEAVREHLADCPACREKYEQLREVSRLLATVAEEEIPAHRARLLRQRLEREMHTHPHSLPLYRRPWVRACSLAAACLVLVIGITALTGNVGNDADSPEAMRYATSDSMGVPGDMEMELYTAPGNSGGTAAANKVAAGDSQRKVIRNASLTLEVADINATVERLTRLAADYDGYVVSCRQYNGGDGAYLSGQISLRVDAARLDDFMSAIESVGSILDPAIYGDDITEEYYDLDGRLALYTAQRDRLLSLYEQAGSIEELIALENELTRVEGQIEAISGSLRLYDQQVALSLVDIQLRTPAHAAARLDAGGFDDLGGRLAAAAVRGLNGLLDFLAGVLVFLARVWVWLLLLAVAATVFIVCRKRRAKKQS